MLNAFLTRQKISKRNKKKTQKGKECCWAVYFSFNVELFLLLFYKNFFRIKSNLLHIYVSKCVFCSPLFISIYFIFFYIRYVRSLFFLFISDFFIANTITSSLGFRQCQIASFLVLFHSFFSLLSSSSIFYV